MKIKIVLFLIFIILSIPVLSESKANQDQDFEIRCGWFDNPTPGNISLFDADGEWILGIQIGYQLDSDWQWPEFKKNQWVYTNVHYGYGCVCFEVLVDYETRYVLEVKSNKVKPLEECRNDKSLTKWNYLFK